MKLKQDAPIAWACLKVSGNVKVVSITLLRKQSSCIRIQDAEHFGGNMRNRRWLKVVSVLAVLCGPVAVSAQTVNFDTLPALTRHNARALGFICARRC